MFPSAVTQTGADGKPQTSIQPVKEGQTIQSRTFSICGGKSIRMLIFKTFRVIW